MKFITAVSVILFVICGTFSSAFGVNWISVYSQGGVDYYYDEDSIAYDYDERIKVDTKIFFETDAVRKRFIKQRRDAGLSTAGWNEAQYVIGRVTINCSSKRVNFLSERTYDYFDRLLTSQDKSTVTHWNPIADDSPLMLIIDAVCGGR